jgi:subtilisin-like proprotein convertase family protein
MRFRQIPQNMNRMKRTTLMMAVLLLALARPAQADFVRTFSTGFQNGGVIPDGRLTGWSDTRNVVGAPAGTITDVSVTLNLSGGWNGDLYAYLVHNSGFAVLLNRVGRSGTSGPGYGSTPMNVRLDDAGALGDIHTYGGGALTPPGVSPTLATSYQPDGRNVDPLTGNLSTAARTALLSSFNGLNTSGGWTLFIADVSGGDVSTLNSWTLGITEIAAVPEPASLIEGSMAVLFLGGVIGLYRLRGPRAQRPTLWARISAWPRAVNAWLDAV